MSDEGDDGPEFLLFVSWAEGRHAGHANPVFDDPVELRIAVLVLYLLCVQFRWGRIQPLPNFGQIMSRRAAAGTAHGVMFIEASLYKCGVRQGRRLDFLAVATN